VLTLPRRSSAVLFALAFVCALLLGAGVAVAAGSGGSKGSSGSSAGSAVGGGPLSGGVTTTTSAGGGGSIGKSSIIGIVVGAVIVIGGVCFFIFRDARRRAPSRGRRADAGSSPEPRVPGSQRVKPRKLSAQERRRRKRGRAPRRK